MIYEMISENSRSTVSFSSFLVYFSTYIIILQENIGILFENQMHSSRKWLEFLQFYSFQIIFEQISCKSFCFVVIYFITTRNFSEI